MSHTILRQSAVSAVCGLKKSTLYSYIARGLWTPGLRIGHRSVGWPATEVAAINGARISGADDEEIKKLVAELVAARKRA
jgi:prophage regulatory protein